MQVILWVILAVVVALAWSFITVRRSQLMLKHVAVPSGEPMPMTAVQRVVWQALVPTLLFAIAAAATVGYYGVLAVWDNDDVRIVVTLLLLAALGGYTYYITRLRTWLVRDDGTLDERDRAILAAAPAGQAPAMMVATAAWMIYLTEAYHETHLVPSAYLLMVSVIASLVGILIGYRRS
jgi:hypothetical protein